LLLIEIILTPTGNRWQAHHTRVSSVPRRQFTKEQSQCQYIEGDLQISTFSTILTP